MRIWSASFLMYLALGLGCIAAQANDARQECNEMYPAEAYDAEERSQYIAECMAAYDDGSSEAEPELYEGTVEDFVNEMAPEESSQ